MVIQLKEYRLSQYREYIFDIHYVDCSLVKEREYLIKSYLLNNSLFKCVQGNEYFSGPFHQILEVFNFISNLNDDKILYYINNKHISLNINKNTKKKILII